MYLSYLSIIMFYFHFDMLRSDVLAYWEKSLNIKKAIFDTWWVPGYPLLIAIVRTIFLNLLHPLAVMVPISFIAYISTTWLVYKASVELGWHQSEAKKFALFFAAYPLVGLTYSVYPIADALAIAMFTMSFVSMHRAQWVSMALWAGAAMITHKVTWFFIPPLLLFVFITVPNARKYIIWSFIPIVLLEIAGIFYHHDIFWMVRWSKKHLMTSQSKFLLFDGLIGSLVYGDLFDKIKGLIVLSIMVWAISLFWISNKIRYWPGIIIGVSIIVMIAIINQYEIWVIVRFSKILLISSLLPLQTIKTQIQKILVIPRFSYILIISFGTNVLYGYYMARIFYS